MGLKTAVAFDLLADRYPEIYFAFSFKGITAPTSDVFYAENDIAAEIERLSKKMPSEEIEILYLFGLGLGQFYPLLHAWLQEDSTRHLVILDDDLEAIAGWLHFGHPEDILKDKQVHLRFVPQPRAWKDTLKRCVRDFPCQRMDVLFSDRYAKTRSRFCSQLRLQLLRKTGLAYTYFMEALYAHFVININLLHNAGQIDSSFEANRLKGKFEGIPAVICGAGPSLGSAVPLLNALEDRALIFSGGSAVTALGNLGVLPHVALAIDPNKEEHERFKSSIVQEVPLLYGHRLHPDVFATFNGPKGYVRSCTGASVETWLEEKLGITGETLGDGLDSEAMSITTLAFATAVAMGCNPIILIGVDLSYIDLKRYAPGVMQDSSVNASALSKETEHLQQPIKRKNAQGQMVATHVRWIMEADALGKFAKKYPGIEFFNASEKGLRIPNLPYMPLSTWSERYAKKTHDLRGRIHAQTESVRSTSNHSQSIEDLFFPFVDSLKNLQRFIEEAHQEISRLEIELGAPLDSGKLLALNMQCEEESAYIFLHHSELAFDHIMARQFNLLSRENTPEDRQNRLRFMRAKWEYINQVVCHYLDLVTTFSPKKEV